MPAENRYLPSVGRFGALMLAAAGVWCTRGLLDIIGESNAVTRVALLPPWWLLAALVVIFGLIAVAAERAGLHADVVLPLCALGLLAVPYLPWLPDQVPVLRAAAGPARHLLWLVVLWLIAYRGLARLRWGTGAALTPAVIFVMSAIIYGAVAWRLTATPLFPQGDEPHYLVMTQSLLHDGDLRIEDNHQREEYRAYLGEPLRPDYLTRGVDGQIYSVHPVGLPILAVPAFALGGYRGVVAMLVLIAALAAALLWRWAREITGSTPAATFGWAAAGLTGPYLFNSFTVFPEIPAALAVMVAVTWRTESTATAVMLLRGVAIGALPWLSTKYAPMAAVVTIVLLLRARRNRRATVVLLAPITLMLAAWFAFFFWVWGTVSPSAPYGSSEPTTLAYLARGGPGLLFDQEYGAIAYAPVLAIAFVGLVQMLRSGGAGARRALELTVVLGALLCTVGAFHLWWGGTASPGRPVASGVLLLGVPIAWLFASAAARPSARAGCQLLLASSLAIACAMALAQDGALLNNDRDGSAALLTWLSPTWPVSAAFPSFIAGSWAGAIARTLVWLGLGTAVAWLVHRLYRDRFGAAALGMLVLGLGSAVALVALSSPAAAVAAWLGPEARARVPLLDGFDTSRRPITMIYNPLSTISSADALSRVLLIARPGLRTARQPLDLLWNARFALPAGEYRVQVKRAAAPSYTDTTLGVQIGRVGAPIEQWEISGSPWEHQLVLPIDAIFVGFRATPDLAQTDSELRITPVKVVDERKRAGRPPVLSARRYDPVTAFFHDDLVVSEPNGYWTQGGTTTQITYAADASSPATINLVVHCGPVANQVRLATPGWEETLVLEPGTAHPVAIPTVVQPDLAVRIAALDVSVQGGFVPADLDRANTDRRFLGCWLGP